MGSRDDVHEAQADTQRQQRKFGRHAMAAQRIGAQLPGPPPKLAEAPGFDASEANTLGMATRGPVGCSALLGGSHRIVTL
jgi:hypothetical protein